MGKPLTANALARGLLRRLQLSSPLRGLDAHVVSTDREAIDATISADCVLRVRAQALGSASQRTYSVTLEIAYPSIEAEYDQLWSVAGRGSSDRYFPLGCSLSELAGVPPAGLSAADPNAVDLLTKKIIEAIDEHVWALRDRESAMAELERRELSLWYGRVAFENWLPVALSLGPDCQRACALARKVLAEQREETSPRAIAYRQFVTNLERHTESRCLALRSSGLPSAAA